MHPPKLTTKRKNEFLNLLSEGFSVSHAAAAVNISRWAMYQHRANDEEFAAAWNEAVEAGTDKLEDEARRRAFEGVDEPVFYQGMECGVIRKYSDTLLIVLLKARRPGKYRENVNLSGEVGVTAKIVRIPAKAGDAEEWHQQANEHLKSKS